MLTVFSVSMGDRGTGPPSTAMECIFKADSAVVQFNYHGALPFPSNLLPPLPLLPLSFPSFPSPSFPSISSLPSFPISSFLSPFCLGLFCRDCPHTEGKLLVSSLTRTMVLGFSQPRQTAVPVQVGSQLREGLYGACFHPSPSVIPRPVLAARPGKVSTCTHNEHTCTCTK